MHDVRLLPRRNWSREELIIAFNLYCKTPFGRIHIRNPQIIQVAKLLRRTPSAVSWKLANFARLDPLLKKRNIAGAEHGARAEAEIWNEFDKDWEKLAFESERLITQLTGRAPETEEPVANFPQGVSRDAMVRIRINQSFFRAAVLAAYDVRCCITGLSVPELLTASHIIPWASDANNRTNPHNGLCLNALHDRAFDCGLLTVTPELKVKVSPRLRKYSTNNALREFIIKFESASVCQPRRFAPSIEFLRYHNERIFRSS